MGRGRFAAGMVALSVLVATMAVGCSSSGSDGGSAGSGGSDGPSRKPVAARGLSGPQLVDALAGAGIATDATPSSGSPIAKVSDPGPMRFLRSQVDVLALQTRDRSGTTGAQLDELVGPIPDGPPFSLVVAGYVSAGKTPGAKLARKVMGDQPWVQAAAITFPDVVLALFANDVARDGSAAGGPGADDGSSTSVANLRGAARPTVRTAALAAPADGVTGICSTLSGWVDQVLQTVVDALKVDTSGGGVTGVLGSIWNAVVDLAVEAGKAAVGALTGPIVGAISTGLAIVGTLSMASGLLKPWSVTAEQDPDPAAYGVEPGDGNPVAVKATVDASASQPFAPDVLDCAQQAGVPLPDPTSAKGSKVTWTPFGIDAVGTGVEHDDEIGADGTASLRFTTRTESKDDAESGDEVPHAISAAIGVERTQVEDLEKVLQTILTKSVPGVVGEIAGAVLGYLTAPILEHLAELLGTSTFSSGTVISHGPAEEKPKPGRTTTTTAPCATTPGGAIPDGTYTGPIELDVDGDPAHASGTITSTGGGTMTLTVAEGKVTGGTWSLQLSSSGTIEEQGGGSGTIKSLAAQVQGSVGGTAAKPELSGSFTIHGEISVSVQGFSTDVPIDESGSTSTALTVEESSCDEVTGTFIPSFNEATGGQAYFSGLARWTGTAS